MNSIPANWKKVVATKLSTNFRDAVQICAVPGVSELKPTEVLVKNRYVGINASDVNFTAGRYKPDVKPPFDCGFEAIGEVMSCGENVDKVAVGDAVITQAYGAFAEYQVISMRQVKKAPSLDARWLPLDLSGTTAAISLGEVVKPQKGEVAVVTAASGGTGQFAVQLLKHVYGCRVIGVTMSPEKEQFLKDLGCDDVIVEKKESVAEGLKRLSATGVNLAYESVGGQTFDAIVDNIAIHGRILSIGAISGYKDGSSWSDPQNSSRPVQMRLLSKSAALHTFFLPHFAKHAQNYFSQLCDLSSKGVIKSCVDSTEFKGLESIPDAVEYMFARKNKGKVVVQI